MSNQIFIYEVLNLLLFVKAIADIWQPRDTSRYKAPQDLTNPRLTQEEFVDNLIQRPLDMELAHAVRSLVVIFIVCDASPSNGDED